MAALPPPVALPVQPHDPLVPLPAAPAFPPTIDNVLQAVGYRRNVDVSIRERLLGVRCTANDRYNSVLYEHSVVSQAAAAAAPQAAAPPWAHQLRVDIQNDVRAMIQSLILPDLKRTANHRREDGTIVPFEMVPFNNGTDPTEHPNNLPALRSVNDIENLNGHDLVAYLAGYGVDPVPVGANPDATNRLWKETLKRKVGVSM